MVHTIEASLSLTVDLFWILWKADATGAEQTSKSQHPSHLRLIISWENAAFKIDKAGGLWL